MTRGGKRKGAGRKAAKTPTKKTQVVLRMDQVIFLSTLPKYKKSAYVRDAIDEKRERDDESNGENA
jgi:hypothetical protein